MEKGVCLTVSEEATEDKGVGGVGSRVSGGPVGVRVTGGLEIGALIAGVGGGVGVGDSSGSSSSESWVVEDEVQYLGPLATTTGVFFFFLG